MNLARYDRDYGVRDRARFLSGLVSMANIGRSETLPSISAEDFARGQDLDPLPLTSSTTPSLSASQVFSILFERNRLSTIASEKEIGTFLALSQLDYKLIISR